MLRKGLLSTTVAILLAVFSRPAPVCAQQASGIAGTVKDASGAVLPGVTVEASSPALIERVRTTVTDSEGLYKITDLRPGTYVVTFSLQGFSTIRSEGIELTAAFTATVNADMRLGPLNETITVTGASLQVDIQNVRVQTVVSNELLAELPTGLQTVGTLLTLAPGLKGAADVGGSAGAYRGMGSPQSISYHGQTGMKVSYDDMAIANSSSVGTTSYIINTQVVEEMTLERGGINAESNAAGFAANAIPREGGNVLSGSITGMYTNDNLQSNNLTDDLRSRGVTSVDKVRELYDSGATLGGAIIKNRLWFFGAVRSSGNTNPKANIYFNKTQGTPFYTPDLSRPAERVETDRFYSGRFTWQASPKNKLNFFIDTQNVCRCIYEGNEAPEASFGLHFWPQTLTQATWRSTLTSRFLLEAGVSMLLSKWETPIPDGIDINRDVSILELSNQFRYNAPFRHWDRVDDRRYVQRFAASYVTGSHAFKAGLQIDEGIWDTSAVIDHKVGFNGQPIVGHVSYRFMNGRPNGLTQYATPNLQRNTLKADLGLFAQDQWRIKRLTLNYGVRFDYFNGYVPPQTAPAGPFIPERNFPAVHDVPNWKDINPRLGASYDVFGNGKTAVKASMGRYVNKTATAIASAINPLVTSVNEVNRNWDDTFFGPSDPRTGNFHPDCDLTNPALNDECGPYLNSNFGRVVVSTNYADDVLHGFAVRPTTSDFTLQLQHQLFPKVAISGGYFRNWAGNFTVTDNLLWLPEDFSPYCVTAPIDQRLPNGGGYDVCGLYDISLAKSTVSNNLVTQTSDFGEQTQVSDFFAFTVDSRLGSGIILGGGIDTGRIVTDQCFVVDSPQRLLDCRASTPFASQTQVKLFGSYPLPADFTVSGTFQNLPGPEILANWPAPNSAIAPTLGRNLAACGTRSPCTSTATVPLIRPQTVFEERRTQLDLRLSRRFKIRNTQLQANFDVYNALNASPILGRNNTYGGTAWGTPVTSLATGAGVLDGRLFQFSGRVTF